MALLEINNLSISFGGLRAVDDFHVSIEKGELYGLIGPNGAGKTTVFNLLTGEYKPNEGTIVLDGEDITGRPTIEINKAGAARSEHPPFQTALGPRQCQDRSAQSVHALDVRFDLPPARTF